MVTLLGLADVVEMIENMVAEAGSQREVARKLGVAEARISEVLNGHWNPQRQLLKALGLERVAAYREVPRAE